MGKSVKYGNWKTMLPNELLNIAQRNEISDEKKLFASYWLIKYSS